MKLQVIREMTDGGVDCSFECTGINDVLREAFLSTQDVCCACLLYLLAKEKLSLKDM